ncbi:MAG TPA: FHA domain-containing protein [Thermoanaerobaculia bacterium]|jgi:DNA-binding winged helix-turn-helix (wHTH) protein
MKTRFGDCVLDSDTRELLVRGTPVHLSPKGLQFLELLLENRPRALSKTEIHEKLWPGTFVSDGTLTSLLAEVRSAIEDEAHESRLVRTVHRFGYAFSGTAEQVRPPRRASAPRLAYRLFWGPREIALEEGETILGRDPDATAFFDHTSVSRHHARIEISGERVTVEDLQSKNGTFLGGKKLDSPAMLADGDELKLGSVSLKFRVFPLSGSTATADDSAKQ